MWTYLTLPFSLLRPGIECEEIHPYVEDGETWRALKANFPASFVAHSTEQTLYFDDKGLIRRHDYSVDNPTGHRPRSTSTITKSSAGSYFLRDAAFILARPT
jgi:hypothetical protein